MMPRSAPAASSRIYILDTSVLYVFLRGEAGFGDEAARAGPPQRRQQRAIRAMLENEEVAIPHIALVEILGQLFHQYIDLNNYDHWHLQRRIAFNPILALLIHDHDRVRLVREAPRFEVLIRSHEALSNHLRGLLQNHYPDPAQYRPREPKCLDGVDAQILDDAVCLALTNPIRRCELVSNDQLYAHVIADIQQRSGSEPGLPGNLFFTTVYELPARFGIP
jgi:hypothetical protein